MIRLAMIHFMLRHLTNPAAIGNPRRDDFEGLRPAEDGAG
jgi:hypothetical protein